MAFIQSSHRLPLVYSTLKSDPAWKKIVYLCKALIPQLPASVTDSSLPNIVVEWESIYIIALNGTDLHSVF